MSEDRLLKIDEAAELLKTSKDWLYRAWRHLPFAVKLSKKQLRFSQQGIQEYLQGLREIDARIIERIKSKEKQGG